MSRLQSFLEWTNTCILSTGDLVWPALIVVVGVITIAVWAARGGESDLRPILFNRWWIPVYAVLVMLWALSGVSHAQA